MFLNFILRKAPKPLIKVSVPCDQPQPSTEKFHLSSVSLAKITHMLMSPYTSLE